MQVIIEDSAKKSILDIFSYNSKYSIKNAIETNIDIQMHINSLMDFPYIGRYIPEISDKHFREIIYKKNRRSRYRILYYTSDNNDTIYVFNVMNCKQNFDAFLKSHNYLKNYYNF